MVLKKGNIKVHHFAHKATNMCPVSAGETLQHLMTKQSIYDSLVLDAHVTELELEKDLGFARPDVFAKIDSYPVAVEVQRSILSAHDIAQRTANYHRMGIAVLWVALPTKELYSDRYSPKAWEKWLHAACFGRVYYWIDGQELLPVHYDSYDLWVEETDFGGGYYRASKRWRTPFAAKSVRISDEFSPIERGKWAGGSIVIPACTLWIDKQPPWWLKD